MIAGLPSLSALLRRSRGQPVILAPDPGEATTLNSGESLLRRKRLKVAVFAILFGLVSAAIELPLPLEDGFRAARAQLRTRPVPQDIAMIAIDDATLNEIGKSKPTRFHDSAMVDLLVAAGVDKIVYDRAHADPESPASDAQFAATLAKHPGKIWLGMSPEADMGFQKVDEIVPLQAF
ncbi:MAG: CHASE2 domain-containing protein, partial [Erythrobacter cryptus]